MSIIIAPPTRVPPLDGLPNPFAREWRNYLQTLQTVGQAAPQILQETAVQAQTAAITTTPITLPGISAGFYRVCVYFVITIAAAVSSSLTVTIGWTDNGNPSSRVIPALTTNTLGANGGQDMTIHVDNNSPITYAVAYASNAANQMTYNIGIVVEQMA